MCTKVGGSASKSMDEHRGELEQVEELSMICRGWAMRGKLGIRGEGAERA